ncbi:MAG: hypothetical protein QOE41_2825 [Mycobacterium sp.]|jgi:hypothetical protein|nr:hypothetical protein [Mycobacterium sp.]MDT5133514.1 hypothetical protein [Mycobacterium sp.]
MRIKLNYITPLLVAGAAAAAIAAAPVAAANPQSCVSVGGSKQCQTPGNVQINSSLPPQSAASVNPPIGSTYGPFFSYNRR